MPTKTEDHSQIKYLLSKLYLTLKSGLKKNYLNIEDNSYSEENEEDFFKNISIINLINCISIYVNYLMEKKEKNNEEIDEEEEDEKPLYKQYEKLLIKAEGDIRRHIKIEQQLKIKIEDLEFELDDYRAGRIKKKVKNLLVNCEPGYYRSYNYQKQQKNQFKEYNNYNENNKNKNNSRSGKPISVNSNSTFIISKLKKENENLKLKLSKLENDFTNNMNKNKSENYKQIDNKLLRQKLNDNGIRINKNIINNKNFISKNNYFSFATNTYTNNFYNIKDKKYKNTNNNSTIKDLNSDNKNYILYNYNTTETNSFIYHQKRNKNKNGMIISFPFFKTSSNNRIKSNIKKLIYDKNKAQLIKIQNSLGINNNGIEIKTKDINNSFNTVNKINNKRTYTLNNYSPKKNLKKRKMLKENKTSNLYLYMTNNNLYNTDRKKRPTNYANKSKTNLDSKERKTLCIPNCKFNLTWSKFPLKNLQTSANFSTELFFNNTQINSIQSLIRNSTNLNNNVKKVINKKLLSQIKKKLKNNLNLNQNKLPNKIKKNTTTQKITINLSKTMNKTKNHNSSMKNLKNVNYIKPKMKDEFNKNNKDNKDNEINICDEEKKIMMKTQHNFYFGKGEIYVRKRGNMNFGVDNKNNNIEIKKNNNIFS